MALSNQKLKEFILEELGKGKRLPGLSFDEIYKKLVNKYREDNQAIKKNLLLILTRFTDEEKITYPKYKLVSGKPVYQKDLKKTLLKLSNKGNYHFNVFDYHEEEVMIVLDMYLKKDEHEGIGVNDKDLIKVSKILREIGKEKFGHIDSDFRNEGGISRKVGNILRWDPLAKNNPLRPDAISKLVWDKYSSDPRKLSDLVKERIKNININTKFKTKIEIKNFSKNEKKSKSKNIKTKEYTKTKPEADLVDEFKKILNKEKVEVNYFIAYTPTTQLTNDIYLPKIEFLIEAKSNCSREKVREVIGQIKDYAKLFFESEGRYPLCGALFPEKPIDELLDLLKDQNIFYFYLKGKSNFESNFEKSNLY